MKSSIQYLQKIGFVTVPYPKNLRTSVNKTVVSWKKFCELPASTKQNLPYSNNTAGVGYELKEGVGKKADRKENFDITTAGTDWLKKNESTIKNPIALDFIEDAAALLGVIKPLILNFAKEVEETFKIKDFQKEVKESELAFFVRFIHYFGNRDVGEETATAHADQSGFTLHLFESDPGLQCLTGEKEWIDMPVTEGETVIIPAMQLQLRSEGKLKALCHRVIATPTTAEKGRYSAVCFVQLKKTPKYDKEKHGRLQEKEPGFNYSLSHNRFQTLFK